MNFPLFFFVFFFSFATYLLIRSRHERHLGVLFIIRTNLGVRIIDSTAKIQPRLWAFIADFATLITMGGAGAFYLSTHKASLRHFHYLLFLVGTVFAEAALFQGQGRAAIAILILSVLAAYIVFRLQHPIMNVVCTMVVFSIGFGLMQSGLTQVLFGLFGLPAVMIYWMLTHGWNILTSQTKLPGISPMLPAQKDGNLGVGFPGFDIFIPWWHVIVAMFVTLVAHEGAHGVLTRVANIKLKSTGVLSLLAMPLGAFVEPDEEEMKKRHSLDRMRIFAMGSFANLVVGFATAALIIGVMNYSTTLVQADGVRVIGFMKGYPIEKVMPVNTVIQSINGKSANDIESFKNITAMMKPGASVVLGTDNGTFIVTMMKDDKDPKRGLLGVFLTPNVKVKGGDGMRSLLGVISFMLEGLFWVAFFNLSIALVNILPLLPFDGGRMFKELIHAWRISPKSMDRMLYCAMIFMVLLFIVNAIPLYRIGLDFALSLM
jgi:membrane-associated protease RseP (regulator of RpoE activity)